MIDLMVSLAIVAILIALMFPAITSVRESARKVKCASNLRQIGLGIEMYAQDNRDNLPASVFLPKLNSQTVAVGAVDRMDTVLLPESEFGGSVQSRWDGMGLMFRYEYVSAPGVFYCPSHRGNFAFVNTETDWGNTETIDQLIVNYLYRGMGSNGERKLTQIQTNPGAAFITDSLRSYEDLNHKSGFNVLQAGLAVNWFEDIGDQIANDLLLRSDEGGQADAVVDAWGRLDDIPVNDD
jgi:type II secretory pathway pseudopilin PulG